MNVKKEKANKFIIYSNTFTQILKILIFSCIINPSLLAKCLDKEYPVIRQEGDCLNGNCELSEYESGICKIENDIIKTQWFTSIIQFTDEGYTFALITTTDNGDLIVSANHYTQPSALKYYYGLKKNGRPYFSINGKETPITTTISDNNRCEGNIFGIKLKGDKSNKEYIIGFGIGYANFELYDFENNNTVYKQPGSTFFNTDYNYFYCATIFKLESEDNYYIIGIIEKIQTTNQFYFHIMKLEFTKLDINSYSPIIIRKNFTCFISRMVSCFETKSKNIICFYLDDSKTYVISVFDEELNSLKSSPLYESEYTSEYLFFKCIHFIENSGIFFYYEKINAPVIQFKKYSSGEISNHFTSIDELKLFYNSYNNEIKYTNLMKINDKKFCIINTNLNKDRLNIIIIHNFSKENIKIRYYTLLSYQLFYYQFKNQISSTIYNGLIAIGSSYRLGQNSNIDFASLIILSYPNSTDFDFDIAENIEKNENALINLNQSLTIENNLFGYIFYGIKIINYTNGLNIISSKRNTKIKREDFLIDEKEIILIISKEINIPDNSKIEYAMVITEPEYNDINNYTYKYEEYCGTDCDDEKNIEKELFVGRTSYCNIIFNSESLSEECNIENCAFCLKSDANYCTSCQYYYDISDDGKEKICLDEGILPKTENVNEKDNISDYDIIKETDIKSNYDINKETDIKSNYDINKETDIKSNYDMNKETDIKSDYDINKETDIKSDYDINKEADIKSDNNINTETYSEKYDLSDYETNKGTDDINTQTYKERDDILDYETNKGTDISSDYDISTEIYKQKNDISDYETNKEIDIKSDYDINKETYKEKDNLSDYDFNKESDIKSDYDINKETYKEKDNKIEYETNKETDNEKDHQSDYEENKETYKQKDYYINNETYIEINNEKEEDNEKSCSEDEIIENKCQNNSIEIKQIEDIKKKIVNINNTNNNIIIHTKNVNIQFCKTKDQKSNYTSNISNIDLGDCENILKHIYKIDEKESLLIFKTDIRILDYMTTYVEYEIFHPLALYPLNLTYCNKSKINIDIPVQMDNNMEIYYDSLSENGYNLFDKNDSFYQDVCSTYTSPNGTDILLSDRKKDIYNKSNSQYFCQKGCISQSYNSTTKKVLCKCNYKKENKEKENNLDLKKFISLLKNEDIKEEFFETFSNSKFHILKCIKLIFNLNYLYNYGGIIMSILLFLFIILFILFCFQYKKEISQFENRIILYKERFLDIKSKKIKNIKKSNNSKNNKNKTTINKNKKKGKHRKVMNQPPLKKCRNSLDINELSSKKLNKNIGKKKLLKSPKIKSKFKFRNSAILESKKINSKKSLIKIYKPGIFSNKNNIKINNFNFTNLNDFELNSLKFELALEIDKRSYLQYYWSLLKQKHIILFAFVQKDDYNLFSVKASLVIISFSLFFTINGFFFDDNSIHNAYKKNGIYDFIFELPKIIITTFLTAVSNFILRKLALSEKYFSNIKEEKYMKKVLEKLKQLKRNLKIRFFIYFFLCFIVMVFSWLFISCFCSIFINTQRILIKDILLSFSISMIYPFGLNLIPSIFRISSLRRKSRCIYNLSKLIAII